MLAFAGGTEHMQSLNSPGSWTAQADQFGDALAIDILRTGMDLTLRKVVVLSHLRLTTASGSRFGSQRGLVTTLALFPRLLVCSIWAQGHPPSGQPACDENKDLDSKQTPVPVLA